MKLEFIFTPVELALSSNCISYNLMNDKFYLCTCVLLVNVFLKKLYYQYINDSIGIQSN